MIAKYRYKGLNWIDLNYPTKEELDYVFEEYKISENITKEIFSDSKDHHIRKDDEAILVVLREDKNKRGKVVLLKDKNIILTIQENPLVSMDQFLKELELDISNEIDSKIKDHDTLLTILLKNVFLGFSDKILDNEEEIMVLKNKLKSTNRRYNFIMTFFSVSLVIILTLIFYGVFSI